MGLLDSPKLTNKQKPKTQRRIPQKPVKKSTHNIVVVKPASGGPNVDKDPDIMRLQVNFLYSSTEEERYG